MADEADTILTHDMIAERALFDLKNQLTFSQNAYKGYTSEFHSVGGYEKGNSVRIHLPNKYRAQDGNTAVLVGSYETNTTVTVDKHKHVALDFTAEQLTYDIEKFSEKYINPGVEALANKVDFDGCAEVPNLYNQVGTPATTPATFKVLADAALRMDEESVPRTERVAVLSALAHWTMADGELKSVFQQNMVDTLIRRGFLGRFALMDFFMDQNIQNHTTGTSATAADGSAAVHVDGAPAEGSNTIVLDGMAGASTFTKGDILTIATVVGVNPVSGTNWENDTLRQFVVTALATENAGTTTVLVEPAFISSAGGDQLLPYQTINDLPAADDNVTCIGLDSTAYPLNVCHHPDCFALTMVPFKTPNSAGQSVKWSTMSDNDIGLSITFASGFDIINYKEIYRLDILYGWDTIRPELGVRIIG